MAEDPRLSIVVSHPSSSIDPGFLYGLLERVCAQEGCPLRMLNIVLADHSAVRALNVNYLSHDYDTDVLAFPLGHETVACEIDGEIYVDLDTARERCAEFNATFEEEVARYVIHGLLHLMGYTDKTVSERRSMKVKEDQYLRDFEIK